MRVGKNGRVNTRYTREELAAAVGRTVPDVLETDLDVLFCGINPGLMSAVTGHHFARPGNRFWPALHLSGFTPRLLRPDEEDQLPGLGLGITNVVARATAGAAELSADEYRAGGEILRGKVLAYKPRWLAVVGIGAYRVAFGHPKAVLGRQAASVGDTRVWVLPNPSGLNAHFTAETLAAQFAELRDAAAAAPG